jgi:hypothetical protein
MAKDFAFIFYPGDYLRDTQCLSEACQVAYDRIMCEHMRNICISQEQLNFFTKRLSPDEKAELIFILKKIPGGFQIEWVAESIAKRKDYSESRSKNRTSKKDKDVKTYVEHMEIENEIENKDVIVINNKGANEKFATMLLESESLISNIQFQNKLGLHDAKKLIDMFIQQVNDTNEYHANYTDYSKHCINWCKHNVKLVKEKAGKLESIYNNTQLAKLKAAQRNGE